jgi:hypothetical protein
MNFDAARGDPAATPLICIPKGHSLNHPDCRASARCPHPYCPLKTEAGAEPPDAYPDGRSPADAPQPDHKDQRHAVRAELEQMAESVRRAFDDGRRRGVQDGLRLARQAVNEALGARGMS